jgi:hypothetical protein
MVALPILAYPNFVDADLYTVQVSGGLWDPAYPLNNLFNRLLVRVARSYNLAASSTRFWVDLGTTRDVRSVSIPYLTASMGCQWRVRGFQVQDEDTTPEADSGLQDLYPIVYEEGSLYWGHPSLWTGKMTEEQARIFPMPVVYTTDEPALARYWLFEFFDQNSTIGYIEVPLVFIAPGWQSTRGIAFGLQQVFEPLTVVQQSWGGAEFFDVQEVGGRRVVRFSLNYLPKAEAETWAADMQRQLGINDYLFFVRDPDDVVSRHRNCFLGRMRQLSPLEQVAAGYNSIGYEISEVVA